MNEQNHKENTELTLENVPDSIILMANTEICYLVEVGDLDMNKAPHNLEEARKRLDWPKWEGAVNEEIKMLIKMGTWDEEPVETPPKKKR